MRNAIRGYLPLCIGVVGLWLLVPNSAHAANVYMQEAVRNAKDALELMDGDRSVSISRCGLQGIVMISPDNVIMRLKAGESPLRLGDKVFSINGVPVASSEQLRATLTAIAATENVAVGIIREARKTDLSVPCEDALPYYATLRRVYESMAKKQWNECIDRVQEVVRMGQRSSQTLAREYDCRSFAGRIANNSEQAGWQYEIMRVTIEEARWDPVLFPSIKGYVLGNLTPFRSGGFGQYADELEKQLESAERGLSGKQSTSPGVPPVKSASSGSGFFVNDSGRLITSAHVISGANKVMVYTRDGRAVEAKVIASSEATDLAVLDTSLTATPFLSVAPPRTVAVGTPVFTYGFPVADLLGSEPKFTDGTVSSLSGIQGEQTFLQISVPVQPGNSGGPLVNDKGQVVGVIAAQAAIAPFLKGTGTLPQNVNWAVKAEYGALLATLPPPQPEAKSRQEAIRQVQQAICYIEASY